VLRGEGRSIGGLNWSPDGQAIVFGDGARAIRHEQTPAYSGSKIIYTINENVPGETNVVSAAGGLPKSLGSGGGFGGRRWLDARHFLVDRTSADFKHRTTSLADIGGGEPKVLHEEVSDKFWSITGDNGSQPSPDGKWIAFSAIATAGTTSTWCPHRRRAVQVTGKFEVRSPQWSPDSTRIAFDANDPDRQRSPSLRRNDELILARRSRRSQRPRHQHRAAVVSDGTRLATSIPTRTTQPISGSPTRTCRDTGPCPTRCPRRWIVRRSSSRNRSVAGPDGQKVPAWLFVPRLDRTETPRSSGSTAMA
jgi:hypothetical protein